MKKKFFKITAFFMAVVLGFLSFYSVFSFKNLDSVFKVKMFYQQEENTVDVLVLGSSHIYQGLNTAVLWREYGYAAYALCGAAQPVWNTYYYLEEALKTQTPKVIILDTYMLHLSDEYGDTSYAIKNTYGLRWSKTKIDAIKASFDTEETGRQYFLEVLQYHSKYSDLNKTDFYPYHANKSMYENHKGFYCYFRSEAVNENDLSQATHLTELTPKVEEYYRKIIELAKSRNIPIIVTAIPFAAENYHQGFFNTAQVIAAEYGVPFYNFLSDYKDEVGINYATDFSDSQHLNHLGNTKITRFFGNLLKNNYEVPDRRGDEKYSSWEKDAKVYYNQLYNANVKKINSLSEYAKVLTNKRYITVITESVNDFELLPTDIKNSAKSFFQQLKISSKQYKNGGMWIVRDGKVDYYNACENESFSRSVKLSRFDTAYVKTEERLLYENVVDEETVEQVTILTNTLHVNKVNQTKVSHGINICVYDTFTQSTVDIFSYNFETGKLLR